MKKNYSALTTPHLLLKNKLMRFGFALIILLFITAFDGLAQLTYTWNKTGTASWAVATNWSPDRNTPAANDVLVFNNGAITTPTNIPTETIGQLLLSAATTVNLQGAAAGTLLTVSGGVGDDLTVALGSALNINVATNTTTLLVGAGATGVITGNMTFSTAAHKLNATDAGGITFNSPAVITQDAGCTGNLFTNAGTANAVIFNTGTTLIQNTGANPFGLTAPASKVTFNTGSLLRFQQNAAPSLSGRTFANLEINFATFNQSGTGAGLLTIDNLTITLGILNLNLTTAGVNIKGNISVAAGQTLTFSPATVSTLVFNGSTPQSITNAGTLTFTANESVTLNNAAGLTLNSDITLNNVLTFTAGKITTGNNTLTITNTAAGAIVGADATKYIITNGTTGGLKRSVTTAINSYDFPVGAAANVPEGIPANYKPATINFTTAPSIAGSLLARFKVGYPGFPNAIPLNEVGPLLVNTVSFQGTWFLDRADGLSNDGVYTGTYTGNGAPDINDFTKLVLIKRPTGGTDWALEGTHVITTGSNANPVLSRTGLTSFSEFAVSGQLIIALPVNLNYLNGTKQNGSNYLNWKVTCTNNPNVTMIVERSADKINFTGITSITADALRCQQPFDYIDNSPLAGLNYYRLKMIDGYGKTTYSAAIAILNKTTGFEIVSLMPSIVKSNAILNVTAAQKTKLDVIITDIAGKQVQKMAYNVIAGSNQFKLNLASLSAGAYQITGYTADGTSRTVRFVKQ